MSKDYLQSITPYKPSLFPEKAIRMAANENAFGTSPKAIKKIMEMAEYANRYPDGSSEKLKNALSLHYNLDKDRFIIGNGSDELLTLIAHLYMQEGCNSISSESSFSEYSFVTKIFGGELIQVPMVHGSFDLPAIANRVNEQSKIIFLCNPNNPTGTYFSHNRLVDFLTKISSEILVVLDEAYVEYMSAEDKPQSIKIVDEYSNIIILRTFSKIYGLAGLRIGYGIANEAIINDLNRVREPFNTNSIAQEAACSALSDSEFIRNSYTSNLVEKEFYYHRLDSMGLDYYPSQANFICINIKTDSLKAWKYFMNQGIIVRPLSSFGLQTWIRITIGKKADNLIFMETLLRFLKEQNSI